MSATVFYWWTLGAAQYSHIILLVELGAAQYNPSLWLLDWAPGYC